MRYGHEYSIYSGLPNPRVKLYALLAIASVALASILRGAISATGASLNPPMDNKHVLFFMAAVTPLTLFAGLTYLFNTYLWRTGLGRLLIGLSGGKAPPILYGSFSGDLSWYDRDEVEPDRAAGTSMVHVRITQNWNTLAVYFEFRDSTGNVRASSSSDMAYLALSIDPTEVTLEYTYRYEGVEKRADGKGIKAKTIRGTSALTFKRERNNQWRVFGTYFSNDGSSGKISLVADRT